jgi:hypothetical protein
MYRTCYERKVDPSNNLVDDELQLRTPFVQPFIGHDEWMVSDSFHIALSEFADTLTDGQVSCKSMIDMEELSLKYLKVCEFVQCRITFNEL